MTIPAHLERTGERAGGGLAVPIRLSIMMLMEFIVFGSWFATFGLVLATHGLDAIIGPAYLLSAIAAVLSSLLLGAIGDRYLAPRTVLCLAHLAGAGLLALIPYSIGIGAAEMTLALIFGYMLLFQPTLGLVISIALVSLGERRSIFPYVRIAAPIGWVCAGLSVGALGLSASTGVFYIAAASSLILAIYAITLPANARHGARARFSAGDLIGSKALVLFREPSFTVLMICTLMTAISFGVYNAFASPYLAVLGISNVAGVLALGQISEVLFIGTIPWVLARIGIKWALLIGMAMWGVRFLLFTAASAGFPELAIVGVAVHGICNDYFVIIAAMYIGRVASADLQSQAQGWLILMLSGFGQGIGSAVAGAIYATRVSVRTEMGAQAWTPLWLVPIGLALATCFVWVTFFRPVPEPQCSTTT